MATKEFVSVWDMYDNLYQRGMRKGKGSFRNWRDNILKLEESRFSLGHLWHGKKGPNHVGGDESLFSFKNLFGVKQGSAIKNSTLVDTILSKGKLLHDYTKYNKENPNEWKDSESNLMGILEHEGKKYAKFVGRDNHAGEINLYELKNAGEDLGGRSGTEKEYSTEGKSFGELFEETKKKLLGNKTFKFGIKDDVLDEIKNNIDSLSEEGKVEFRQNVRQRNKQKKGLKAGVAIAKDFADTLQSAWERNYRG